MSAAACKRRRKQHLNGFKHMDPKKRPHYSKISAEASAKRLARARLMATKSFKKAKA